ncbi:thioredoxin [Patescibacteria group bacterium]
MAEHNFTDDNFEKEVLKSDLPVLVDFFAEWCGPCKMLAPVIEELAKEYDGKWKIGKCNIDENPNSTMEYGVQSVPTLMIVKGGKVEEKMVGFQSKEAIEKKLE